VAGRRAAGCGPDHLIKFAPPEAPPAVDPEEGIEPSRGPSPQDPQLQFVAVARGSTEARRSGSQPQA